MYNRDSLFATTNAPDEGNVIFVSRKYMSSIIDDSFYFLRMTPADLHARDIGSQQGYKKMYKDSIQDFEQGEKYILKTLVAKIDMYTRRFDRLHSLPWKLCKISANIEKGYPHTLGDVIILSATFFDMSENEKLITLLHEKMHVYQRSYPIQAEQLITNYWGFKVVDKHENYPLARNNPDINNFVYAKDGKRFIQLYRSKTPTSISDSDAYTISTDDKTQQLTSHELGIPQVVDQPEHPYEIMGTLIPQIMLHNYKDDIPMTKATIKWMNELM